jgi:hypothetical protein
MCPRELAASLGTAPENTDGGRRMSYVQLDPKGMRCWRKLVGSVAQSRSEQVGCSPHQRPVPRPLVSGQLISQRRGTCVTSNLLRLEELDSHSRTEHEVQAYAATDGPENMWLVVCFCVLCRFPTRSRRTRLDKSLSLVAQCRSRTISQACRIDSRTHIISDQLVSRGKSIPSSIRPSACPSLPS